MIVLLCRKTEDAQYVSSQANGAKDEHEHPNNPEPLEEKKFIVLEIPLSNIISGKWMR